MALDLAGISASTGSACSSGAARPSDVLAAMGRPGQVPVRFSLGRADRDTAGAVAALERALAVVRSERVGEVGLPVIHFTPGGRRLDQALVQDIARGPGAVLLCGRHEGVDQRVVDRHVTLEISLGDYVLSGGELPALVLLDAVARLQPGVLHPPSHEQESFADGLLEGPSYTRPEVLPDGTAVPAVLLSGHHGEIARWRRERSLELTARRRPDLLVAAREAGRLSDADERFLARLGL